MLSIIKSRYSTTYLFEAETYNNVEAVRFLLENGANPNLDIPDIFSGCALHDLHFLWQEMVGEEEKRLEIAKLFYEFGGDPNLPYEMETLFGHVLYEVFDDSNEVHNWEYLKKFFVISLAYGGYKNTNLKEPIHLLEPIDIACVDEYDFKLVKCKDRCNIEGHLLNPDGMVIAVI